MTPSVPSEPEDGLAQVGAGRVGRGGAEHELAGRRGDAQPDDHVVEAAEAGGGLAAGTGGGEAADRGELEGLREVAQREAVLGEGGLGGRTAHARLEDGGVRDLVDGEELVEPDQVEARPGRRTRRGVRPARR